jgi:putative DNA primase/helicase
MIYMYERQQLGDTLQLQKEDGPLERKHVLNLLGVRNCNYGINEEWALITKLMKRLGLRPGRRTRLGVRTEAEFNKTIDAIRHAHNIRKIFEEVRRLLRREDIETSGRLYFKWEDGQRYIACRNVAEITSQFVKPTLLLDATLPAPMILQIYHPQVEVVADLKVAAPPHVHIRQVLDAPTSAYKLMKAKNEKHLHAVRRYILQRWLETGRQQTLVICQEEVERWLKASGLPTNISIEHYNNVSGVDDYRDVRLELLIGRTAPGPRAMEILAGALSGRQPIACAAGGNGFVWYPAAKPAPAIALRDGRGIKTKGDLHPDAFAEAVRWLVHEGELLQALGRARPINRDAAHPLDIDLLFDTALPITVDEVQMWKTPRQLYATAYDDGVMLTSPLDMTKLWPSLWKNTRAADRTVQQGMPELPGFTPVTYQLVGPKMKPRIGQFDLARIPDPAAWLRERLGPVKTL